MALTKGITIFTDSILERSQVSKGSDVPIFRNVSDPVNAAGLGGDGRVETSSHSFMDDGGAVAFEGQDLLA